ncbi:MAG: isoleucine--tRNA ligase [Candidatus Dadabacteria bacterium]|nr:isoleucine--tRNA ligase [Candidatus Dadabacteria bacterium]
MPDKEKKDYRDTLNLPEAKGFPMKAGLLQKEPQIQKEWEKLNLFSKIRDREKSAGKEKFVLHDGPPYANGSIHIGHLLNKILKDIVVRSKTMSGFDSFLIPGWDCHGLPIEHKVLKESDDITASADPVLIRKKCRSYADKFVRRQTKEMKRLGTLADYKNPYLTMTPEYEAGALEVFAAIVKKGIVRREMKPVHWSVENKTALAEAELEYHEKTDPSVYALFQVTDAKNLPPSLNAPDGGDVFLMIWTTTPWTLPANLAVAVLPEAEYGLYHTGGKLCIVADALAETVFSKAEAEAKKLGSCAGSDLISAGVSYTHPFIEREGRVVGAPYVGTEDGTGLVHTAPGHGADDYATGIREGLDIYCPVLEDGTFDETAPGWLQGKNVWEANGLVMEKLREFGRLFHGEEIVHSYPHDWRGKTPTIFRATAQWFIKVNKPVGKGGETLREMALKSVREDIEFHPEWGRKRFEGMLESRPDWCISRQRSWGLPIPAFTNADGETLMTGKTVLAIAEKIREKGSNLWFHAEAAELLEGYKPEKDPDAPKWAKENWKPSALKKGKDIFDVWFESGVSWHSVIEKGKQGRADLYLEGSDQHRGWFQSSLLTSLGATGKPPFKQILTHGFIVDAQGKKMSKSGGNALEVEKILEQYGADVCRWWVASLNYSNDVKADIKIIEAAADEYRTIRNTIRFLLSNLNDFDHEKDRVELTEEIYPYYSIDYSIDRFALVGLKICVKRTRDAFDRLDYKEASREILSFCDLLLSKHYIGIDVPDTLSREEEPLYKEDDKGVLEKLTARDHYIGAVRDRLYCSGKSERRRRKTQTVIYDIANALIKLCAPILVHTAEQAYHCLVSPSTSVHLEHFPALRELDDKEGKMWDDWFYILVLKDKCLAALEQAKQEDRPSNPLDAGIRIIKMSEVTSRILGKFKFNKSELEDLIGVSRIQICHNEGEEKSNEFEKLPVLSPTLPNLRGNISFQIEGVYDLRSEPKCNRCWKRARTVTIRSDGGTLCDRCADVVGV